MAREISDYIVMLRHGEEQMSIRMQMEMIRDLSSRIRRGDIVIHDPREMTELIYVLSKLTQRELPPHYVDRAIRELFTSLEESPILPPGLKEETQHLMMRDMDRFLGHSLFGEEEMKKEKKEEKEEEKRAKVFQSIGNISLAESDRVLFFVGAGASKPSPSNIPTVNELLPELWKKSSRMETRPLEKLQTWCRENSIENIEEMLTAVTISNFIIKSPKVHGLLNSVLYPEWKSLKEISIRDIDSVLLMDNMLNTFFSLLVGTMLQAKPNAIHKYIAEYMKIKGNGDILTTNYDSCIDQAFDELGVKYDYVFNAAEGSSVLSLVKMHGSINWFYCDTCQSVFLPSIEAVAQAIEEDIPYPVTGMCRQCNAPAQQFIIPPTAHKYLTHPPIVQVWDRGRKILEQARVFIIIGYSFADTDDYIAKMLVQAVGQDPKKNVIIVDIDAKTIDKCKSFIKLHVDAFDEKKSFFPLQGDAAELVPRVIEILTKAKEIKASRGKKKATPSNNKSKTS